MNASFRYLRDQATAAQVEQHLRACDRHFVPALSARVDLVVYAHKLAARASRFEAWLGDALVGLVAAYIEQPANGDSYISNVSVLPAFTGQGLAGKLLGQCIAGARQHGVSAIQLEVSAGNAAALRLYTKAGFEPLSVQGALHTLRLQLKERQL